MSNVTVAKVGKVQKFDNVSIRHFAETVYTDLSGFVFHRDREDNPVVIFMNENGCEDLCKFDDLAYITFDTVPNETAARSEAFDKCEVYCLNKIKEHKIDPFKTEIFYIISGYAPCLTILEAQRIVDDLREYVINQ